MFKGIENLKHGRFTPTPEEEEKNPDIKKRMAAANEQLGKDAGQKTRDKLKNVLEKALEDEPEKKDQAA